MEPQTDQIRPGTSLLHVADCKNSYLSKADSMSIRQLRPLAKCLWTKAAISDTSVMLLWPDCAYQMHNEGMSALLQAITPLQQEASEP